MKQKSLVKKITLFLFFLMLGGSVNAQTTIYKRLSVIPPRAADPEGYGNLVAGYDVTGSGAPQIYAVSGELNLGGIVPRIYEFKYNGTSWDSVWASVPGLTDQNTWCPLTVADLDGDGRKEIVWGPVNASPYSNGMIRLIDYEADGAGGDALGVPDGSGGYRPNATWNMLPDSASVSNNSRPFRWIAADVNNDGKQELIFTTRAGNYHFGVISVDNIPDNGDGSETWKMDTTGIADSSAFGFSYPDVAVIDSTIYLFSYSSGDMQPIYYANGKYTFGKVYKAVAPGGTWKTAEVVDLDKTGKKEILVGSVNDGKVYLLQPAGDSLSTTEVADFGSLGCKRLNGSAVGDFNGDGYTDIAFGSRSGFGTPDAAIYVLYYKGGDITSMASYQTAIVDSGLAAGNQWDILSAGKIDANASTDEIVYSGIDRSGVPAPIAVLSSMQVDSLSSIADAKVDANGDFVPDNLNKTFKVMGVVNSINWLASSNGFSYTIQDGSAGIDVYKGGAVGPTFHIGDRVIATGVMSQYKGLNELTLADTNDVVLVDTGRTITPQEITIDEMNNNGEQYESMLVTIKGVAPAPTNKTKWPAANSNANITIWDGYSSTSMYIDKDGEVDGTTEPTYPVDVTGVVSQYSSSTPPNNGYEIEPMFYSDFVQNVAVPPNVHYYFTDAMHALAQTGLHITDSTSTYTLDWHPAIDLNNDALIYQVHGDVDGTPVISGGSDNSGKDTVYTMTAADLLKVLAGKDSALVNFSVACKSVGTTEAISWSVDTLHLMVVNSIVTGIENQNVPHSFFVDQNYPNPFNPTTTITFGLTQQQNVRLIVYDVLGRQVAVLLNNQTMRAGVHNVHFDASRLASGTYIYRLSAGDKVVSKKMILLK